MPPQRDALGRFTSGGGGGRTAVTAVYTPNPRLADELTPGIRAILIKACQAGCAGAAAYVNRGPDRDEGHVHIQDAMQYSVQGTGRDQVGLVIANAPHAWWVENGTGPHPIYPRGRDQGGADFLWWPDAAHPVRMVNHPGTKPQPFLRVGALDAIRKYLQTGSL
jgi:hypothetical protein